MRVRQRRRGAHRRASRRMRATPMVRKLMAAPGSRCRRGRSAVPTAVSVRVAMMAATDGLGRWKREAVGGMGGFATATAGRRSAGALRGAAAVRGERRSRSELAGLRDLVFGDRGGRLWPILVK